jgi:hypothetical protein
MFIFDVHKGGAIVNKTFLYLCCIFITHCHVLDYSIPDVIMYQ